MSIKTNPYGYTSSMNTAARPDTTGKAVQEEPATSPEAEAQKTQQQDVVSISGKPEEKTVLDQWKDMLEQLENAKNAFKVKSSPPSDQSARLTQRLVAAGDALEVRKVLGEAGNALISLQTAAAHAEGKDKQKIEAMIRKINKLMDRASRKIKDLGNEENLRQQQSRAKAAKQQARAEELKDELRRRQSERMKREQGYLREANADKLQGMGQPQKTPYFQAPKDPATEAQIAAEAEAMAAAEIGVTSGGEAGGDIAVGDESAVADTSGGGGEIAADAGADAASAE